MDQLDSRISDPEKARPTGPARYFLVIKKSLEAFGEHEGFRLAAATSFYAALSMAPLVLLLLTMAGTWLDQEAVGKQLVAEVGRVAGAEAADVAQSIVSHANKPPPDRITMILGIAALIFGATGVFSQLQYSLNYIWGVKSEPGHGVMRFLRTRLISLVIVAAIGCILLILPLLTALVAVVNSHLVGNVPQIAKVWQYLSLLATTLVQAAVFATIFKALPNVKIKWSDVWVGAAATAVMFTIGQFFIGLYLGYSSVGSAYGAAGSLVVFLVWLYYSALIMFLGAEFAHAYAHHFGSQAGVQSTGSEDLLPLPKTP